MSSEALAWAFKQDCKSSSVKFTLVALCECANYKTGRITPSIEHICEITGQNRKTVINNIAELERQGVISDTGERVGRTKQIKVYQASIGTVPKTEPSQERNSTEKSPKQSQKRDTEPSLEPSCSQKASPSSNKRAREKPAQADLPEWLPSIQWGAYLDMRKRKRATPTPHAVGLLIHKLEKLRSTGQDPGAILDQSTLKNWTDVYPIEESRDDRAHNYGTNNRPTGRSDGAARALDRQLGLGEFAGEAGRRDPGPGEGYSQRAIASR